MRALLSNLGLGSGEAFQQLSRAHMTGTFNPNTPDDPNVKYISSGARTPLPDVISPFHVSWRILTQEEGENDGLVSVKSAKWGCYRGALVGVDHLDLINWVNPVKRGLRKVVRRNQGTMKEVCLCRRLLLSAAGLYCEEE